VLTAYKNLGVENILAVRGDEPHGQEDFQPHPDSFSHASDFIRSINPQFDFCLGAAGYPEGHIDAESREKDLEYLKMKVDLGAEYIFANYFYDNRFFFDFLERCKAADINVPIVPGVMPVFSAKLTQSLSELCGATITKELRAGLDSIAEDDKEGIADFGVDFATTQCEELIKSGVPGIHIYTMDRSKTPCEIVKRLREQDLL
jgi:methylenetetrahydrofolate reductase (NADPH)